MTEPRTRIGAYFSLARVEVLLALAMALVFAGSWRHFIGGDSPPTSYLPAALLRHGTLRLDAYVGCDPLFDLSKRPHYVVVSGGHYYSKFSPVPAILAAPFYGLMFLIFGLPLECQGVDVWALPYPAWSIGVSTLLSLVTLVVLFWALTHLVARSTAAGLTLAYALGTWLWQSATSTLNAQSSAELFLALVSGLLLELTTPRSRQSQVRPRALSLAIGVSLGLAISTRPQVLPAIVVLLLYLAFQDAGSGVDWFRLAIGALVPLSLLTVYNTWAFGAPWRTGYGAEALSGWLLPSVGRLVAMLVSPAHGLLVYSPLFGFAVLGGYASWRKVASRTAHSEIFWTNTLGRALSLAVGVQVLVMSCWWAWHGGVATNQRMLQEVHPLLLVLVAMAVRHYGQRRWLRVGLWIAALWGIFINAASKAFYEQHLAWLEQSHAELVWSWRAFEPWLYVSWHGIGSFLIGMGRVLGQVVLSLAAAGVLGLLMAGLRRGAERGW